MVTKEYWKFLRLSQKIILKFSSKSENSSNVFDNIKTIFKGIQNKCHDKNQHTYT